jgi:glyoxylase-like metal-dependent hydrolase (beta-lactamase superfamily II)
MKRIFFPFLCFGVLSTALLAEKDEFAGVKVSAQKVRGSVWMLEGRGGNVGVSAGPDGFLLVDDQFAPLAEKIRRALAGIGAGELRFVLNTHWHGDHTGGNEVFGREAVVVAHANVRRRLMEAQRLGEHEIPAAPPQAWPVITFDESLTVHFNGEDIRVLHFPKGHTDGDSVIFFKDSGVVHMGDHYFAGRFPFVDLQSGGSVEGYLKNVARAIEKIPENAKIIPGHGPLSNLKELRQWHRSLKDSVEAVRRRMKDGASFEDIKKEGLPAEFRPMAWEFVPEARWIETVFRSYSEKR